VQSDAGSGRKPAGELTVVRALANGAPGAIVLVNEGGTLKILAVGS
jgi:hypothetical protein